MSVANELNKMWKEAVLVQLELCTGIWPQVLLEGTQNSPNLIRTVSPTYKEMLC